MFEVIILIAVDLTSSKSVYLFTSLFTHGNLKKIIYFET